MASVEQENRGRDQARSAREHGREGGRRSRGPPLLHDPRPRPVRRDRVGAARRLHPRQGQAGVRPEGRRVPQVLVADRDEHRRPEVLPRPHDLPRARALRPPDDRPRRRHGRPLGPRRRLLRDRGRGRDLRGRAQGHPRQPARRLQLARSGSTSASRSSPQCSACRALPTGSSRHRRGWCRSASSSTAIRSGARSTTRRA